MAKVATLSDDFSGFSLAAKWTNDGTVSLSGTGAITVTATGVHSTATYDATSSSAYVQVPKIASGGATAPVTNLVFASATSGTALKILKDSGTNLISFQSQVGFSDGSPVSIYYHPIDHAWWRIRDNGTNTFFETSPDGTTWTIRRTITSPVWLNSITVYLSVDNTPTVGATFDNFNVAPAPVSWYIRKTGSDNNGGSSASITPDQQGTDGVANNTVTWTAASGNFAYPTDVNKGINIAGTIYRVLSINSATSLLLDRNVPTGSGQTWKLGGALQTFAKVFATTTSAIASGTYVYQSWDNIYVGAGVYRELMPATGTTFSSQVTFVGDTDGARTGDSGEVVVSAFLTNDKTAPSGSTVVAMNIGSAPYSNYWSYKNITFVGGSGSPRYVGITESTGNWFTNCTFLSANGSNVSGLSIVPTGASWKGTCFEGCRVFGLGGFSVTLPTATPGEWEYGLYIRNTLLDIIGVAVDVGASGALTHKGGGVYLYNCNIRGSSNPTFRTSNANVSTTLPVRVENCFMYCASTGLNANTSGQIIERNNLIVSSAPRTNVTAGTGSISDGSYAAVFSIGQEVQWGGTPRPYFMPVANSPILGFGANTASVPVLDAQNIPRPATPAAGAYERGNTAVRSTAQTHSGTYSLLLTGPGVQDFDLDVNATSTTVTAWLWYSSGYSGSNPQMSVINGTECGVANNSVSASGTTNAWQQVSLTFTPTSKGRVTIRFISNDTSGTGLVYIDDAVVA